MELAAVFLESREAADRERIGNDLMAAVCERLKVASPKLVVKDEPRPHRVKEGRLSYQRLGSYSPRTQTIRMHNRTAVRAQIVAPRTAFETLIHELVHHLDFEHLGLARSLHTSGFYHRIGYLKGLLTPQSDAVATPQPPRAAQPRLL